MDFRISLFGSYGMMETLFETFQNGLRPHPFCTDDFSRGIARKPVETAMKKLNIEPNTPTDIRWMVYDMDSPTSRYDWQASGAPAPTILVENKENGHAHLMYGLGTSVFLQDGTRAKPRRYLGAVDVGLTLKLDADPDYRKLLCKNPMRSDHWAVQIVEDRPYDLDWLADYLDLDFLLKPRKALPGMGFGRNCACFDETRTWAYPTVREYWNIGYIAFHDAVNWFAKKTNAGFPVPLYENEVRCISRSVARWIWSNFTEKSWRERQAAVGRKGGQVSGIRRANDAELRRLMLVEYLEENPGASKKQAARETDTPWPTASRLLKDYRGGP